MQDRTKMDQMTEAENARPGLTFPHLSFGQSLSGPILWGPAFSAPPKKEQMYAVTSCTCLFSIQTLWHCNCELIVNHGDWRSAVQ